MIYEYECPGDGQVINVERSMLEDEGEYFCATCGSELRRIYAAPPVKFKGEGWGGNYGSSF